MSTQPDATSTSKTIESEKLSLSSGDNDQSKTDLGNLEKEIIHEKSVDSQPEVSNLRRPFQPSEASRQNTSKMPSLSRGSGVFNTMIGHLKTAACDVTNEASSDAYRRRLELEKRLRDEIQAKRQQNSEALLQQRHITIRSKLEQEKVRLQHDVSSDKTKSLPVSRVIVIKKDREKEKENEKEKRNQKQKENENENENENEKQRDLSKLSMSKLPTRGLLHEDVESPTRSRSASPMKDRLRQATPHSRSRSPHRLGLDRSRSRSPPRRFRSRSPPRRSRSRSPPHRFRSHSRSPPRRFRSRSPPRRFRSRSPPRRFRSRSPPRRFRSRSPPRRFRSRSPPRRFRSRSPPRRFRSRSPPRRFRSRSPPRRFRSRSRSPGNASPRARRGISRSPRRYSRSPFRSSSRSPRRSEKSKSPGRSASDLHLDLKAIPQSQSPPNLSPINNISKPDGVEDDTLENMSMA